VVLGLTDVETLKRKIGEDGMETVLDQIAAIAKETVRRPSDIVASYKRGRVIAIVAGADRKGAEALAGRVKRTVASHPFSIKGKALHLEVRFGIGTFPEDGSNSEELIRETERGLHG
jgi:diguanylate cyclase (GGDEF)-like protein